MPERRLRYEAVIGLEVHAQLATRTKIFCGCPTTYGSPPNSQTCPVCLGHPGALPVLNGGAVELALRGALALGCTIPPRSLFARKNYFYPDLPKGYQISQYAEPLATGGSVEIEHNGESQTVGLSRLHLEEDAGKSMHEGFPDSEAMSYVDLNRAGVPLVEIVSRPEIREAEEAYRFLQRLRSILRYTEVCDGNMEQGSLRCDANVSVRPAGERALGTRTELKNLNSFRNVQRALEYEIRRQTDLLEAGEQIAQETILWDEIAGVTRSMRGKEEANDYRYFPDPDIPPLEIDPQLVRRIFRSLPELPAPRKRRMMQQYGLSEYEVQLLTLEAPLAEYYEKTAGASRNAKAAANWILNDVLRELNNAGLDESEIPVPATHLAEMIVMLDEGAISTTVARQELFGEMFATGRSPRDLVRDRGLEQVSDEEQLRGLASRVLADHPVQVEQYRAGKTGVLGFLVGRVMKASRGKANPRVLNQLLKKMLE
jgi:aspartyl-tRNA(Asn)/glutamyl-tRNA(Gln) amidotransferase subunit B